MSHRPRAGQNRGGELGFTMIELVLVVVVIGILTAMMVPRVGRVLLASQVRRSAAIVASDLERAFTLAARNRQPMRINCTCGQGTYRIEDRVPNVRLSRSLSVDSDLGRMTLTFTTPDNVLPVEVYPNGVANKTLTVTVTGGATTRTVTMSTVGQVRIQ
jgi:prepilin-type N-terminal cleavage/methylation domain-containing protein